MIYDSKSSFKSENERPFPVAKALFAKFYAENSSLNIPSNNIFSTISAVPYYYYYYYYIISIPGNLPS